ncbi:MAG: sugar phosphate isomerase/epimerase [Lachnospiraceae bacterium]|nr:sugar phosphate isomerase/epimerase [Lachnospiraceae bacterium]
MKNQVLVSTGALIGKPNGRDYRLLKDFAGQLSCDGFEFMMYSDWYEKIPAIVEFLNANAIATPLYHCQKSIGEGISKGGADFDQAIVNFRINAEMARDIGAKKMVMHLWDGFTSDAFFENNIKAYAIVREIADSCGVELLIENVVCNQKDPMTHWCELAKLYPDIKFIFDTKMAAFHGQLEFLYDPAYDWLWKEGHIRHYHVNDYAGGIMDWANLRTLPIGAGHIDFERFFAFVRSTGYEEHFTLESTAFNKEGVVDIDMLNRQVEYVKKNRPY